MKPIKRWAALVLAAALSLALTGCGSEGDMATVIAVSPSESVSAASAEASIPSDGAPEASVPREALPEASDPEDGADEEVPPEGTEVLLDEDGTYTSAEDVSLYLVTYGELPDNFITKKEAKALGWPGGDLEPYAPGKCIGGDLFGNYEGLLPEDRDYHECDIDTLGAKSRGAKRLVFSDDGLIYYTEDHYESFTLLYGEE